MGLGRRGRRGGWIQSEEWGGKWKWVRSLWSKSSEQISASSTSTASMYSAQRHPPLLNIHRRQIVRCSFSSLYEVEVLISKT